MRILPRTGTFRLLEAAEIGDSLTAEARFLDVLATDARNDHARLRRLTAQISDPDHRTRVPSFTLLGDWMPSASARPSGRIILTAGMLLCIEQTILRAMADESFFDLFDTATEWQGGREPRILRRPHPGTPDLLESLPSSIDTQAAVLPLDAWRACQFELLRTLAVQWVHLHEEAHIREGHILLLLDVLPEEHRSRFRALGMSEAAAIGDPIASDTAIPELRRRTKQFGDAPLLSDLRRALELQADHAAFVTLTRISAATHADDAFARYEARLRRYAPDVAEEIGPLNHGRRIRAMVTAAGAVMLVVEALSRAGIRAAGYPSPMARLLNLQLGVLTVSSFVRQGEGGLVLPSTAADDPEFVPWLKSAMMRPYVDLDVMSVRLGLTALFNPPAADGKVGLSPLVLDLLAWFDPDDGRAFVTDDARELHASINRVNALEDVCAPYRAAPKARPSRPKAPGGSDPGSRTA